jgi:hypothetical protein
MGLNKKFSYRPAVTDQETVLWFGKYRGCTIRDVLHDDPHYLVWANDNVESFELGHELLEVAECDADPDRWELMTGYFWRWDKSYGT